VATPGTIRHRTQPSDVTFRSTSSSIREFPSSHQADSVFLRQDVPSTSISIPDSNSSPGHVHRSIVRKWCHNPYRTSNSSNTRSSQILGGEGNRHGHEIVSSSLHSVEVCSEVGRRSQSNEGVADLFRRESSSDRMGSNQNNSREPISSVRLDGDRRTTLPGDAVRDAQFISTPQGEGTFVLDANSDVNSMDAHISGNRETVRSFIQTRSDGSIGGSSVARKTRTKNHSNSSETSGSALGLSNDNSSLRTKQSGSCSNVRNAECDDSALIDFAETCGNKFNFFLSTSSSSPFDYSSSFSLNTQKNNGSQHRHSITRRAHTSTIPDPQEMQTLPLHTKPVSPLNIDVARSFMSDEKNQRFGHLFEKLLCNPHMQASTDIPFSGLLSKHASQLCSHHIAERVDLSTATPTRGAGFPFVVKESKVDEGKIIDRLRFIFWPRRHNDFLKEVYTARVDLRHISSYIDAIRTDSAATADLACGFFQVELPSVARCWFRFRDAEGNVYQMTRLPMGISVAVEIMQMITETLIGSHLTCSPQHSFSGVTQHAFVDDFRVAGSASSVDCTVSKILQRASQMGVTFKSSLARVTSYEFLGLAWNHSSHSICIGTKLRFKIPTTMSASIRLDNLESLTARLIHCSGALRLPLIDHYLTLKWVARRLNELNHGRLKLDSYLSIPPGMLNDFNRWIADARSTKIFSPRPLNPLVVIYSDASLKGWGAILINHLQQAFVTGGAWPEHLRTTDTGKIGMLEAMAISNALADFDDHIMHAKNLELRVDNTSVVAALIRGTARAESIAAALKQPVTRLAQHDIAVTVKYVKSEDNIADPVSRLLRPNLTREEVSCLYARWGGGGIPWRSPSGEFAPSTKQTN
jgi:hypothetical protein